MDSVVTKLIDIQLSFPFILFAIAVIAISGPKVSVLMLVLAARSWTTFAVSCAARPSDRRQRLCRRGARARRIAAARHPSPHRCRTSCLSRSLSGRSISARLIILEFDAELLRPWRAAADGELGQANSAKRANTSSSPGGLRPFPALRCLLWCCSSIMLGDGLRDILDPRLKAAMSAGA